MRTVIPGFSLQPVASPMRILRQLLFRQRAEQGATVELEITERQIVREETAIRCAAAEATNIEMRLANVRQELSVALTDKATPGIVDADEARVIARALIGTAGVAHKHTQRLEALT